MGNVDGEEVIQGMSPRSRHGERILVSVRVRPLNEKELTRKEKVDWECINDTTIIYKNNVGPDRSMYPSSYTFDKVFRSDCSTRQVYEEGAKPIALSVVGGINSSVFAYGQTSSGKTYTMTGITEYAMVDIFKYIQMHKDREFVLKFSAMEIYNESVRDLLTSDNTPLRLLDDPERGTVVEKLTEETLRDWDHLKDLLAICEAQRQMGETLMNESSSRSHQILRLTIESSPREIRTKDNSGTLVSSVNFVDLAGSERASQALSAGSRLKEGSHINRSLLTLGTVIRKLSTGRTGHVPYRDSKLTRILQSSLGGNARTAIICTMSPARSYVEQTRNTLLFASCAKEVSTNARVNVIMSDKVLMKQLQRELSRLENELRSVRSSARGGATDLLREKDLQIEKLERQVKELTLQRDLALSQIQDLQHGLSDDKSPIIWEGPDSFYPKLHIRQAWESPNSEASSLVYHHSTDTGSRTFEPSQCSGRHSRSGSDETYLLTDIDEDILSSGLSQGLYLENSVETSSAVLDRTPDTVGFDPYQCSDGIGEQADENLEDFCRDVRCIESDGSVTSNNSKGNPLAPDEEKRESYEKAKSTVKEPISSPTLSQDRDSSEDYPALPIHSPEETPSPHRTHDETDGEKMSLPKSQSRQESITSTVPPWLDNSEIGEAKHERKDSVGSDKAFMGRLQDIERRLSVLRSDADSEMLSRKTSQNSTATSTLEELKAPDTNLLMDKDVAKNGTSAAKVKEVKESWCGKELADSQVEDALPKTKNTKNVGLDSQDDLNIAEWPTDFKKLQKEIIYLWHSCNVSLIYRSCFFLLFRDDPADTIYLEVERRRLSFLKDASLWGDETAIDAQAVAPSSRRSLQRERDMLARLLKKRLLKQERNSLFLKWGIQLDSKQRSSKLADRLWTSIEDMNHIEESSEIVARLVRFNRQHVRKEMFGINLMSGQKKTRSYSWKRSPSLLL